LVIYLNYTDIFINCNWVVTRWQYTFTHKQYVEQVLPWHLPYNWRKSTEKPQWG